MADKKISQLPVKGLPVSDDDLFEVSVFNGVDYDTFSVSGADVKAGLPATNVYNSDGTLSGNRNVDANGYQLQISNAGVFIVDSSFAPSGGNGTFTLNGYGTSGSDLVEKIASDSGVIRESYGDKNQRFYGKLFFSANGSYIGKSPFSDNPAIIVADGGYYFGVDNASQTWQGNLGGRSHHLNSSNSSNYTEWSDNGLTRYFRVGRLSDNYKLSGYVVNDVGVVDFINFDAITGRTSVAKQVDFSSGVTKHNGLTTTQKNALTPEVGMVVFDSTLNRYERYDSVFGWVTMAQRTIHVEANTLASLTTGSNFYFGNMPVTSSTTIANRQFKSPYNGKITGASIRSHAVSVAGDRTITVSIRINDTTDYLVQAVTSTSANREFINFALNTNGIPITTSDNIAIKVVASGGTTDSTNILFGGTLIVQ